MVKIGDNGHDGADIATVELHYRYPLSVACSYKQESGYTEGSIVFALDDGANKYTIAERANISAAI